VRRSRSTGSTSRSPTSAVQCCGCSPRPAASRSVTPTRPSSPTGPAEQDSAAVLDHPADRPDHEQRG